MAFLIFTYWAAGHALSTHGVPQRQPTKIVALPPGREVHNGANGYVISVRLIVRDCTNPVKGSLTVVLPQEFSEVEERGGAALKRPLFGVAFSDPQVDVNYVGPTGFPRRPRGLRSWSWAFHRHGQPAGSETGRLAVARFDHWTDGPQQLAVDFTAPWLRPRAYGSCWLPTPELVGNLLDFTLSASENVNSGLGPRSGAQPLNHVSWSGHATNWSYLNDGRFEKTVTRWSSKGEYSSFSLPPSVGAVQLISPMTVLAGESTRPPGGTGRPAWVCPSGGGDPADERRDFGVQADGAFRWDPGLSLTEYEPNERGGRCDGWVALVEPGSQSRRDLWLLAIGAALSAGIALLVDAFLHRQRGRGSE